MVSLSGLLALALVAVLLYAVFRMLTITDGKTMFCTACGQEGICHPNAKGRTSIELGLWVCFILPGVLYSLWRLTTRRRVCPSCGSSELVQRNLPVAVKMRKELGARYMPEESERIFAPAIGLDAKEDVSRELEVDDPFAQGSPTTTASTEATARKSVSADRPRPSPLQTPVNLTKLEYRVWRPAELHPEDEIGEMKGQMSVADFHFRLNAEESGIRPLSIATQVQWTGEAECHFTIEAPAPEEALSSAWETAAELIDLRTVLATKAS